MIACLPVCLDGKVESGAKTDGGIVQKCWSPGSSFSHADIAIDSITHPGNLLDLQQCIQWQKC